MPDEKKAAAPFVPTPMLQIIDDGGLRMPVVLCAVCAEQVVESGVVVFQNDGTIRAAHRGFCDRALEKLVGDQFGWRDLDEFLHQLSNNVLPRIGDRTGRTYLIREDETAHLKIGFSSRPDKRPAELATGNPRKLRLLWSVEGDYEAWLHDRFRADRIGGEWFKTNKRIIAYFAHHVHASTGDEFLDKLYDASLAALMLRKQAAGVCVDPDTDMRSVGDLKTAVSKSVGWFSPHKGTWLGETKAYEALTRDLYALAYCWDLQ